MRPTLVLIAAALALTTAVSTAGAQGFQTGAWYVGPRVWLGNLNGAAAIGAQVERGLTEPGQYGPGILAAGGGVDYYSWSNDYFFGRYEYSVIPVQAFGNYHFVVKSEPRLDPYVGLSLVYSHVSAEWSGSGVAASASASGTDIAGVAGARWFVSERFAVQGQVGFGYGTLGLGVNWRF